MFRSAITLILVLLSIAVFAQSDLVKTDNGDLSIHPILHGTLALQWDGKTIYVDPYGGADRFKNLPDADLILITDIHGDHLNTKTLEELDTEKSKFVVPQAVADKMGDTYQDQLIIMGNGESREVMGMQIEALPMYNLPESPDSRHTKGRGNGYLLNIGGKRIYISGDTEDIPEMRALENVDIAFVCMNLPYTMDINQAASAVLEFQPKVIYPFHYRGKEGLADVEQFRELVSENKDIEVRLRQWYPQ